MTTKTIPHTETNSASVQLDALRGAAALLVFVNHTRALYFNSPVPNQPLLKDVAYQTQAVAAGPTAVEPSGAIKVASAAVVVFFVLSGYLVGGSVIRQLRSDRWSWKDYLTKRLVRLWIVLIPALLIGAALDHVGVRLFGPGSIYTAPHAAHLGVSVDLQQRSGPMVLLGNALFLQTILAPIQGTNLALWSLANEFWYYIAFPLALCAFFPQFGKGIRVLSLILGCIVLWFVGSSIAVLFPVWMMGAAVSMITASLSETGARWFSGSALAALLLAIAVLRLSSVHVIAAEYIIGALTAALIYGITAQNWPSKAGLYERVARFFSDISYSLYLFHLPLAVFLCALMNSPYRPLGKNWKAVATYTLTDLAVLGIVYLLWYSFEARTDLVRSRIFEFERKLAKRGYVPGS